MNETSATSKEANPPAAAVYGWQELAGSAALLATVIVLFVLLRRAVGLVEKTVSATRGSKDTHGRNGPQAGCNVSATSR